MPESAEASALSGGVGVHAEPRHDAGELAGQHAAVARTCGGIDNSAVKRRV